MLNAFKGYDKFALPASLMLSKKKRTSKVNLYDSRGRVPAGKVGTYFGSWLTMVAYFLIAIIISN